MCDKEAMDITSGAHEVARWRAWRFAELVAHIDRFSIRLQEYIVIHGGDNTTGPRQYYLLRYYQELYPWCLVLRDWIRNDISGYLWDSDKNWLMVELRDTWNVFSVWFETFINSALNPQAQNALSW